MVYYVKKNNRNPKNKIFYRKSIAKQLIGENSGSEKEYLVRVRGKLDEKGLALLNHGLSLDGEKLRPAKVEWQNEDQLR